jgi:hypothetical protein
MAGKRCAPGFQRAENRYFDIKWRPFRIFRATRRFDRNAARLAKRCNPLIQPLND